MYICLRSGTISEKLLLHVSYGEGEILYGPEGVDFDHFNSVER
jgi:hypothetical protein